MLKKLIIGVVLGGGAAFLAWYQFIALKPAPLPQEDILASYHYPKVDNQGVTLKALDANSFSLSFKSFDGAQVNGQITFPASCQSECPVIVGVSAMGRNYNRWWIDSWKGRPTVTHVNKLGEMALKNGYALVAIDARFHGSRKDPNKSLRSIMNDLDFFGEKTPYENMIVNTVKDYRALLDWLSNHERIDKQSITMAGYSMGAQVSLLTAAVDPRVSRVISVVPPYLDDKVARVAPKNLVSLLKTQQVLLVTSDDDEYASVDDNLTLFKHIASTNKEHIVFEGDHLLPATYVESVTKWLVDKRL